MLSDLQETWILTEVVCLNECTLVESDWETKTLLTSAPLSSSSRNGNVCFLNNQLFSIIQTKLIQAKNFKSKVCPKKFAQAEGR